MRLPGPFPKPPYRLGNELVEDLVMHLDREATGGVPSPEDAARLLRRLREAMTGSLADDQRAAQARVGFLPTEEEQHPELYRDAGPP